MQIPIDEKGIPLISVERVKMTYDHTKELLGEDYKIIASPLFINKIEGNDKIVTIDCKEYTYNELIEIIEKAQIYDMLSK